MSIPWLHFVLSAICSGLTCWNCIRTINSIFEYSQLQPALASPPPSSGVHKRHAWVNVFPVRTVGILQLGLASQQNVMNGHNEKPQVHAVDPRMLASM